MEQLKRELAQALLFALCSCYYDFPAVRKIRQNNDRRWKEHTILGALVGRRLPDFTIFNRSARQTHGGV